MNEIPPPPGLSAPSRRSMEVEPTEAPPQNVEMEEQTEEDQKRLRVLSINHVGVLKKVKMGKDKTEETEILLNEEVEELAYLQETPLDPTATHKRMIKEAENITEIDVYDKVPLDIVKGPVLSSRWVLGPKDTEVKARIVVRGFKQAFTDAETASPTPSLTTMMTLLTLGLSTGMEIHTGHASTA